MRLPLTVLGLAVAMTGASCNREKAEIEQIVHDYVAALRKGDRPALKRLMTRKSYQNNETMTAGMRFAAGLEKKAGSFESLLKTDSRSKVDAKTRQIQDQQAEIAADALRLAGWLGTAVTGGLDTLERIELVSVSCDRIEGNDAFVDTKVRYGEGEPEHDVRIQLKRGDADWKIFGVIPGKR